MERSTADAGGAESGSSADAAANADANADVDAVGITVVDVVAAIDGGGDDDDDDNDGIPVIMGLYPGRSISKLINLLS